ncbi:MAG: ATP-binding protein, partial [Dehalococcoidia bacterium]
MQQYRPELTLSGAHETAVVEVCTRLDGIPLAIELAAACVKVLTVEQIAARLSDRFRLLTGGSRTALPRHQTLRATLDWSYDLLTTQERAFLRRLAVFAGGFALEAVEAVDGDGDEDALSTLLVLVDKSLVMVEQHGDVVRYRLLETVRQYAAEKLDAADETGTARDRHLAWCLALVEAAGAELYGPQEPMWLDRLEQEHDNLRAALSWSLTGGTGGAAPETALALRLAGALPRFWQLRGHWNEGRQWLARVAETGRGASLPARATVLCGTGVLAYMQGDYAAARVFFEQGLTLSQELGDRHGIAIAQDYLGWVMLRFGDHATARVLLEASLAVYAGSGYKPGIAGAQTGLGFLVQRQGDDATARAHYEATLAIWRELGNKDGIAGILEDLATVAAEQGDIERQMTLLEESLALHRELGNKVGIAHALSNLGMGTWRQGDRRRGTLLLEESLALYRELGDRRGIARVLGNRAFLVLSQRDYAQAEALCRESVSLYRELGDRWATARYLPVLAGAAFGQGQPARAARLFAAAAAERERLGATLPPNVRRTHDRTVAAIREALGDAAFAAVWSEGQALSLEEAVARALTDPA